MIYTGSAPTKDSSTEVIFITTPRTMTLEDKEWIIFEYKDRKLKIDPASGLWIRVKDSDWKCLATPCNVSGALQAVEFLTSD